MNNAYEQNFSTDENVFPQELEGDWNKINDEEPDTSQPNLIVQPDFPFNDPEMKLNNIEEIKKKRKTVEEKELLPEYADKIKEIMIEISKMEKDRFDMFDPSNYIKKIYGIRNKISSEIPYSEEKANLYNKCNKLEGFSGLLLKNNEKPISPQKDYSNSKEIIDEINMINTMISSDKKINPLEQFVQIMNVYNKILYFPYKDNNELSELYKLYDECYTKNYEFILKQTKNKNDKK